MKINESYIFAYDIYGNFASSKSNTNIKPAGGKVNELESYPEAALRCAT